jgi:hypothetical protein
VTIGSVTLELTTTYGPDARLGLWVPVHFRERYEEGVLAGGTARTRLENATTYEEIVCEAKYTNFRRFETTARIKRWQELLNFYFCVTPGTSASALVLLDQSRYFSASKGTSASAVLPP